MAKMGFPDVKGTEMVVIPSQPLYSQTKMGFPDVKGTEIAWLFKAKA